VIKREMESNNAAGPVGVVDVPVHFFLSIL